MPSTIVPRSSSTEAPRHVRLPYVPLFAANDACGWGSSRSDAAVDLNALVGHVAGIWMARSEARRTRCHLVLELARELPHVLARASNLAFALSGWLTLLARDADEAHAVVLRVVTRAGGGHAHLTLHGPDMPSLGVLRAVVGSPSGHADRLAEHCSTLVRTEGGRIALAESEVGIGIRLSVPVAPRGGAMLLRPDDWTAAFPPALLRAA
ncbi:MAG: hypothetical protein D6705_06420 [Deltaproteobacteria bacterium]|nr:MAG: hypothetical protein D6705_06420 [Deltaproteobacteria bacterium]